MQASKLGMWSASILFLGGLAYVATVAFGMSLYGLDRPIEDPVLAVMEVLTLLLAPFLVVTFGAVHALASPQHKTNTLVAFAFASLLAGITISVHFVELTALRQLGQEGLAWPSSMYAAELLAWDVFLGLALLFAAPTFRGGRLQKVLQRAMVITGTMCIIGVSGPLTGTFELQFIAVAGYGLIFPFVCLLMALFFRRFGRSLDVDSSRLP